MKTCSSRIIPDTKQMPRVATAAALRIETLCMKTKLTLLKLLIFLCTTLAVTSVSGQVVVTWTNNAGGLITTAANWDPNQLPNGNDGSGFQQIALWDSRTTQDMVITNTTATLPNTGFGTIGINITLDATHTKNVQFISTVADPGNSGQIGLNFITNNSPNGQLVLGDFTTTRMRLTGRPAGAIHYWENNSTAPLIVNPSCEWQAGGGTAYEIDFSGTGDFDIRNSLRTDNGGGGVSLVVNGPGSILWTNGTTFVPANDALNTVTVNAGKLTFANNLLTAGKNGNGAITINGGLVVFKTVAPADADTISRALNGASPGVFEVNNGTLTLSSGSSTFSGNINLTGGKVIVAGAETESVSGPLGLGGTISFTGGTLGYSVNNIYDYSARFSAAAGQAYSIDTGGQSVTFTNAAGLTGSGNTLTKLGNGTLTLAGGASTYGGLTTVSLGKLVLQSAKTGTGNITVADGAALGVVTGGTQVTPSTLTVGTSGSATLEFNSVSSTTTAPIAAGSIAAGGPITVNVNSGTLAPGNSYPLFSWSAGAAPEVSLGVLNGFIGTLTTNGGNTIVLNVTATAYKWSGGNNGNWDTTTANNWQQNGGPVVYGVNGPGPAIFDDTASGNTSLTINSPVSATLVTFNNVNTNYSLAASGANNLGGSTTVLQAGSGTTTLAGGANTYTGITTISGGALSVGVLANGGSPSDIGQSGSGAANLVLNGGRLQYTGSGASIDRLFTLGTSGGTIDDSGTGALVFNNPGALGYNGNGPRTLTLAGADTDNNTLAAVLANNGGATSLIKNGAGKWILTGNNTYSGVTTIAGGTLQVGAAGGTGALGTGNVINDGVLNFNRTGTLTVSGIVSGTGSVINDGTGTVILAADNTYSGGTTINAGTLQVGNGGGTGKLNGSSAITDNGTLIFNSTAGFTMSASITGTGQLIKRGAGLLVLRGGGVTYSFSGGMTIDTGAQLQLFQGNEATYTGGPITNNGTLFMVRQDTAVAIVAANISGNGILIREANNANTGDVTLTGTNTYGGANAFATIIRSGGLVLGDNGVTPYGGSITGHVQFANGNVSTEPDRYLTFNRAEDYTFSGNIVGAVTNVGTGVGQINPAQAGRVIQSGSGVLTLTGNNTYPFGTTINAGTLVVGNGGTSGTIGNGAVTDNGVLVFNRAGNLSVAAINGVGSVVQYGPGTTTLTASNSATGPTTVSNGTLVVSGRYLGGDLLVEGGTVTPAASGTVAVLDVAGNMTINGGTVLLALNKALAPSNSVVNLTNEVTLTAGTVTATGGTLKLINGGPALVAGDKFTLFSQPVTGGALLTIVSPGFTVANNLAVDGSVTVTAVLPPPTITATVSGGNTLNLTWPAAWTGGVHVQGQTNAITVGLSNNWVTIPGTDLGNTYSTAINPTNRAVFFRLINP